MSQNQKRTYSMKAADIEAVFEAIMQNSKDGLFITDHKGTVIMVNRATEEMVEFDVAKILGKNVQEIVDAGYYDKSVALEVLKIKHAVEKYGSQRKAAKALGVSQPTISRKLNQPE